ncbi:efflux RND transporter periplasmic adaptor subunit [Aurantimonas sp. VKM B-3413]|nr:efflux RND transporter periplasmic adaptor subunit [Aurantimonas sp. VKM B-3413]MCB8836559.1 efflux RND transporter periplasmic adaptor subunit [Aurantimonas sp. VKM B-3413]
MHRLSVFRSALLAAMMLVVGPKGFALAQGGAAPPPPAVSVETVTSRTVPVTYDYPGRVAASREVEVRARVGGILLTREFDEGARVKPGELLFKIDPATYQAQVALAQAQVGQAEAQLSQARRAEARARTLARSGASSQSTLDDAVSARELAEAQVAAAEAQLRTANLSLDYATVKAPVAGITSLEQVPEGSLLSTGDLLTKINQLDPIYVNFSAADTEAATIREMLEEGKFSRAKGIADLDVTLMFGDGQTYSQTGRIDFTSTTIDTDTGTILSRAVFPNSKSQLLPGQFVRVEVKGLSIKDAITVPTEALMQGPQGTFVYVVDDKNVAAVRPITVSRTIDDQIVVSSGLGEGDRVITEGVVKVRPGAPVAPQPAAPQEQPAEAGAAPAAAAEEGTAPQQGPGTERKTEAGTGEASQALALSQTDKDPAGVAKGVTDDPTGRQPPVPLSALPDGADARRATRGETEQADAAR